MSMWKRVLTAVLTVVLVAGGGAGGFSASASAGEPTGEAAAPAEAAGAGYFDWLIRPSFDSYVGGGTPIGGASKTEAGKYRFLYTSGGYDPATRVTDVQFSGGVHYEKYQGAYPEHPEVPMLDVTISDPRIVLSEDGSVLFAHVISRAMNSDPTQPPTDYGTIVLANLDVGAAQLASTAEETSWTSIGAGLSEPGVPAFAGFYHAGDALDSVTFTYPGAGDYPTAEERFDAPGMPKLVETGQWQTGTGASAQGASVFVPSDGSVVFVMTRGGLASPNALIYALDPTTLQPLNATPTQLTDLGGRDVTVFDPASSTFYAATYPGSVGKIRSYAWDGTAKTFTEADVVADLGPDRPRGLAWDGARQRFLYMSLADGDHPNLDIAVISKTDSGWSTVPTVIPNGTVSSPRYGEKTFDFMTQTAQGSTWQVLNDGSILIPSNLVPPEGGQKATDIQIEGGTVTRDLAPTLLTIDAGGHVAAAAVEELVIVGGDAVVDGIWTRDAAYSRTYVGADGDVVGFAAQKSLGSNQELPSPFTLTSMRRTSGQLVLGEPVAQPDDGNFEAGLGDPIHGVNYLLDGGHGKVSVLREGEFIGELAVANTFAQGGLNALIDMAIMPDGSAFFVPIRDGVTRKYGLARIAVRGVAPVFTTQPEDLTVTLAAPDGTAPASLSVATDSGTAQWQAKAPGAAKFSDLAGATTGTYAFDADAADNGTQYRAVVANDYGTVVSDIATLTVHRPAQVLTQPGNLSVTEGTNALFTMVASGNPVPEVIWQRRVSGFWQPIDPGDDNFKVESVDGASSLRVLDTNLDQSGSLFRAKVTNSVGTVYSRTVTLTVNPRVTIPEGGLDLEGVLLEWTGSEELQSAPPFGGSNFFSAGVSDGDEATYQSSQGNVKILQVTAGGQQAEASWATRAAHVTNGGHQLVRFGDGAAHLEADGSGEVAWDGAWSVNFYGGLVPFTLTDPELTVAADGVGTLTADLSGCGSSMENPNDCTPLPPVPDVTVATFSGVEIDPAGKVTIDPDYAGVEIEVPAGQTPQNTSVAGWGSWPQGFVDFHFDTGLSSYWYSSGGAADAKKPPQPFIVDFTDAEVVEGPEPTPPVITTQPASTSALIGADTTLTVEASGEALTYRWQKRIGSLWIDVPDEDNASLSLSNVVAEDAGQYRVQVSNPAGSVTSQSATVTIAKHATTLTITTPASTAYGQPAIVTVKVPDRAGEVTLTGAGATRTATLASGTATFTLPTTLAVKPYTLTASYAGDATNASASASATLTVSRAVVSFTSLKVTKKPTSTKAGKATIALGSSTGAVVAGKVTIVLKKGTTTRKVTIKVADGTTTVTLPKLTRGTWKLTGVYQQSPNFTTAISKTIKVKVAR